MTKSIPAKRAAVEMIQFPHAKINLGLSVVSRRADGFHNIETIFFPVPLYEALEIVPATETSLAVSGLPVPGKPEDNLLMRAWQLMKKQRPGLPSFQIILHKAIPMGAGLGGGSSDAACLLQILNDFIQPGLSAGELNGLAAELGSDCAFFLQDRPCLGTGRGEILEPVSLDLAGYDMLMIHPSVSVSTAWAYGKIKPAPPSVPLNELIKKPVAEWKDKLINDFEAPVFEAYPELAQIKTGLYNAGASYAAMSGSGSTLFGLFPENRMPESGLPGNFGQTRIHSLSRPVW